MPRTLAPTSMAGTAVWRWRPAPPVRSLRPTAPASASPYGARLPGMIGSPRLPGLTLADADWLVEAALAVGAENGYPPLAVAVIDVAGEVIALRRGDGGMPMTSRIAVAKARSALIALKPSGLIDLPSGIVESIQHLYHGDFVPRAGGVLVTEGDVILGAAGASGARAVEDEQAVQAAVERWRAHRPQG